MAEESRSRRHVLVPAPAEDLCLSFANTRFWRGSEQPTEQLSGPGDLASWLAENAGAKVSAQAARKAGLDRLFDQALGLREAIYRTFLAIAQSQSPPASALATLNVALAETPPRIGVAAGNVGYSWIIAPPSATLGGALAPVIWSAADLLTHAESRRIRRCANDKCLWLFIDHSKGGTRRWCDMKSCGNREKAHRHYARSKQS